MFPDVGRLVDHPANAASHLSNAVEHTTSRYHPVFHRFESAPSMPSPAIAVNPQRTRLRSDTSLVRPTDSARTHPFWCICEVSDSFAAHEWLPYSCNVFICVIFADIFSVNAGHCPSVISRANENENRYYICRRILVSRECILLFLLIFIIAYLIL